jgi:capsular polysaccharide transport system permease protein
MAARGQSILSLLRVQGQVLVALMLRDIHSRFGSAPAFVLAILWPLSHIVLLVGLNVMFGRTAPYGESAALWFATGVVPFMIFSYTSRFVMLGVVLNRPLLAFPQIKILDILFSRSIIECLISALVIIVLMTIFAAFGVDFWPNQPSEAFFALLTAFWLGIGFGLFNAVIAMIFAQWVTVYALFLVLLWLTGGIFFVPSQLPAFMRELIYFHPSVHCSEWLRSAYYDGYSSLVLDKRAILAFSTYAVFFGLVAERAVRGRMLN